MAAYVDTWLKLCRSMYLVMAYLKFEFEYKSPAIPMKRQKTGNYKINFFTRHNSHAAVPGVKLCEIIIR